MIEFSWPWIFLLLPLPLLAIWHQHRNRADNAIKVVPRLASAFDHLHKSKTTADRLGNRRQWKLMMLWLSWIALLFAIAQPGLPGKTTAQQASGRAMSVLIDLSTSMERRDFSINDELVDRLTVVKDIASSFIANRIGDRVGLVLFGSEAFIGSPLSYDLSSVVHVLQSSGIGMAGRTTAMGDAMGLALRSLREDPARDKAMVLLSDGTNNAGSAEPEDAARLAKKLGIRIYTIGLGSDSSAREQQQFQSAAADLDEDTLKAIANESGGRFFRAQTTDQLSAIYREIDTLESSDNIAPPLIIKLDLRNGFIWLLLVCTVVAVLLSRVSLWKK